MASNRFQKPSAPRLVRRAKYGIDRLILVEKQKIHYVEAGKGEPVVFVPGTTYTRRLWKRLMPLLDNAYRVILPDLPDIENTEQLISLPALTDILAKMIKQMNPGKVNLVGGGWGGTVAFDFAARYSELVNKIISIGGSFLETTRPKGVQASILYLYGTKSNYKDLSLEKNLRYLAENFPQAWIVALEGSIFESVLKNPPEVANLLLDFLRKG